MPDPDRPEFIACIPAANVKDFHELYRAINFYANNRTADEYGLPKEQGEVCLALVNEIWHRAIVLKSSGDGKPIIQLIDLFSDQHVSITKLIPMPVVFMYPGLMAEMCRIEGLTRRSEEFSDSVKENELLQVDEVKADRSDESLVLVIKKLSLNKSPRERGL